MAESPSAVDVHRLRRRLIGYATVGAFVIGVLAAGLTVLAFAGRLTDAVAEHAASAARASATAIYEVAAGRRKVVRQIGSRTRARQLLGEYLDGSLGSGPFTEQSSRILGDALSSGEDIAGITRVTANGARIVVGEPTAERFWPLGWESAETILARGPLSTAAGLRVVLAAPIREHEGPPLGVDIVTFTMDEVAARLAATKMEAGGTTRVYLAFDTQAGPRLLLADGSTQPPGHWSLPVLAKARQGGTETTESFVDDRLVNVTQVGLNGWAVVVTQTTEEVFSDLLSQLALVSLAVLGLAALGAGGIYLALRPIAGMLLVHADTLAHEVELRTRELNDARDSLVQAEKMASLGNLVAGVAHEINTPVGVVLTGASHLATETLKLRRLYEGETLSTEEMEAYLDVATEATSLIESNAYRAADLIQSFKRVAVDRSAGERRRFPLRRYIEETLISLRPQLKKRPIVVTVDGPDDMVLDTFPGALSQIVTNWVINSLTHGFAGDAAGRITLRFHEVEGGLVELTYSDDGAGIAREHRGKVFDPFFTTRRNMGGSGLGLHIVFNLATRVLGGSISLAEDGARGTTFVLRIPMRAPDTVPSDPDPMRTVLPSAERSLA